MLLIELDRRERRARLVRQYTHPRRLLSPFVGNAQMLPNGNIVVGWGGLPYITEFRRDGGVHFDARLPGGARTTGRFGCHGRGARTGREARGAHRRWTTTSCT